MAAWLVKYYVDDDWLKTLVDCSLVVSADSFSQIEDAVRAYCRLLPADEKLAEIISAERIADAVCDFEGQPASAMYPSMESVRSASPDAGLVES